MEKYKRFINKDSLAKTNRLELCCNGRSFLDIEYVVLDG